MPLLVPALTAASAGAPFSLGLERQGLKAKAYLRNASDHRRPVLVDGLIQPTRPILHRAGEAVEVEDVRARSKFDATPLQSLFVDLAPGAKTAAGDGGFVRVSGAWELNWGPFSAQALAPGRYTLAVAWSSKVAGWNDDETRAWHAHPEFWRGQVVSQPVAIDLPG